MVKFAVCDEREMANYISDKLREYYPDECEIKIYEDGAALLDDCRNEAFDAFFLDIDMPETDGTELAKKIRESYRYAKIIFVTNREDLANMGYFYDDFRFVSKNKLEAELHEAANSLKQYFDSLNDYFIFKTQTGKIAVDIKNIMYFTVKNHTVTMVSGECEEQVVRGTMKEYRNRLEKRGFILIHKSYLVNYRYIHSIEGSNIKLQCGKMLPLSRHRADEVENKLHYYLVHIDK